MTKLYTIINKRKYRILMKKGLIQIGLWNVNEKLLMQYLQEIESDFVGTYHGYGLKSAPMSERSRIHDWLWGSLELADTNKDNYKLLLKIAKGKYRVSKGKRKNRKKGMGGREINGMTIQIDAIERPPPLVHLEKCSCCYGTAKVCPEYHPLYRKNGTKYPCKCVKIPCDNCKNGMMECSVFTNANDITHKPDNWTLAKLTEKQMSVLSDMHLDEYSQEIMWQFCIDLDKWINKQLEKDKEFFKNY